MGWLFWQKDSQFFRLVFQAKMNIEKVKSLFLRSDTNIQTEAEIREGEDSSVGAVIDRVACDFKK